MCLATMDESGDTGMKLGQGSSALFTIGMVLFQEEAQANACRARIQALRPELGMKRSGKKSEFHFREMDRERREPFLRAAAEYPFHFYTCTITKERLSGKEWNKKQYMYQRAGVLTLDQARHNMLEAKLLFDATSSKTFDWEFLRFLKKHAGSYDGLPVIAETQRLDSYKDDLVQMIDMVVGAVMAEDRRYFRLIRHKEKGRIVYPP
jgi:Protein of unknown function (DUF3800)